MDTKRDTKSCGKKWSRIH